MKLKIANIEAWHAARCASREPCGCFERLVALLRREPDPYGEYYRWPVLNYNVPDPRLDEWRAMGRTRPFTWEENARESMLRGYEDYFAHMAAGVP